MPKANPLTQGLEQQQPKIIAKSRAKQTAQKTGAKPLPPSRAGRVLIGGHFAPQVQRALKIIAAEEGTTVQALLTEGLNNVFAKRRKPEIAATDALH